MKYYTATKRNLGVCSNMDRIGKYYAEQNIARRIGSRWSHSSVNYRDKTNKYIELSNDNPHGCGLQNQLPSRAGKVRWGRMKTRLLVT